MMIKPLGKWKAPYYCMKCGKVTGMIDKKEVRNNSFRISWYGKCKICLHPMSRYFILVPKNKLGFSEDE